MSKAKTDVLQNYRVGKLRCQMSQALLSLLIIWQVRAFRVAALI
ncbi:hypothetical protein ENTCAN_06197 [Enterobacter cancerogenus ATCC 35316]|nr:hypothetical protein ENTCAN_06197 [Enterobacter cancerogenus ATCC 35316]